MNTETRKQDATDAVENLRIDTSRKISTKRKAELGQFFTPMAVARLMASMIDFDGESVGILDAGAGVGSLFTAAVAHLCRRRKRPRSIHVTAYELDAELCERLKVAVAACTAECEAAGIAFSAEVIQGNFLEAAADALQGKLFADQPEERFDLAILNPPYFKINNGSKTRKTIERIGIETSNIYTGFLAAATLMLRPGGEMVAITPRSFCNGTYFRPFRTWFLGRMRIRRIHSFSSREEAFRDDDVLQETVIFRAMKSASRGRVTVTSSPGPEGPMSSRVVYYEQVVRPDDPQAFIRILTDDLADLVSDRMAACRTTLAELDLTVSTGRVVDFRAKQYLRKEAGKDTVPLIWPTHFNGGYISWPKDGRKPNAIVDAEAIADQLVPNEHYVLTRRFSAKEERRRVVAAIYDATRLKCRAVGFENHLNYFHQGGRGLDMRLARGLAVFLNSTLVDQYFRQFSGHTQVNATDLRNMCYPTREQLEQIGSQIGDEFPDQGGIDTVLARELFEADPLVTKLNDRVMRIGTSRESRPA